MVRATAIDVILRDILARMERLGLDAIRTLARLHGFEWTDAEIEAIRPAAEASLAMLARLRAIDLGPADPTTQFRIL
jgi:hypothetical protein